VQFLFGDYALDIDRRELRHGSELISIGPQVFDLLVYLVQNRERVVSKDDLFGAVWSGRIVSESTLTTHINAVRKAVGDSGDQQTVIRTVARKGFRFVGEVRNERPLVDGTPSSRAVNDAGERTAPTTSRPALPDKPSIAVLPFQNLSGDPEQEYFADGMVEDITMALSRMPWLFVIARNSSFSYKGRAVNVKQVGRELGVRYVLEGSVRKAANRVRIAGQLIDATTGAHIWADRFEGTLADIFDLQDQVTTSVVGAIAPKLEQAEIERSKRKPTENLDAYDYYLRGIASLSQEPSDREANSEALVLFLKAIELDPEFSAAYGMAAWCYVWRKANGWVIDRVKEFAEAERLARRAVALGKDDAVALARGGHALAYVVGELEAGAAYTDQALILNPNFAVGWMLSGLVSVYSGEPDVAVGRLARAVRLSPFDPLTFVAQTAYAMAHFFAGRCDDASSWAAKVLRDHPDYQLALRIFAAANALTGRQEEARQAVERLRQLDPALRISNLKDRYPLRRPEDLARWAEGLRRAGLPE
jgi:TolB-like protein/tetratricopeptide (TPR) repeat protein